MSYQREISRTPPAFGRIASAVRIPKRRVAALLAGAGLVALAGCATAFPLRFPEYPAGDSGQQLWKLTGGRRNLAVVARPLDPAIAGKVSLPTNWVDLIEGRVGGAVKDQGYFTLISPGARKERLRELARSQTGLTSTQLAIGQEIQADLLLILSLATVPRTECSVARKSGNILGNLVRGTDATDPIVLARAEQRSVGMAIVDFIGSGGGLLTTVAPVLPVVGVRDTTVFVTGTLVNVETGQSMVVTNTEPFRLENDTNLMECPSELKGLDAALTFAAYRLVSQISPRIILLKVPLADDSEGVSSDRASSVVTSLKKGNDWAEEGNLERARVLWAQSLDESGGKAAAALWNLGVYLWHTGDFRGAASYFDRAIQSASSKWMDADKKRALTRFEEARQRLDQ